MILEFNTTEREEIYLTLIDKNTQKHFEFKIENQSDDLLLILEKFLKKNKIVLQDLKVILVNLGPGSFTGTRVGVTVANTLAWTLNIPIYGYQKDHRDKILAKILKNPKNKFSKSVIPYYEIS